MYSWSLPEEVGNRRFCIFSRDNFEIGESAPTTSMAASPTAAMGWCGIACSVRAPPVRARDRGGQRLGRGPDGIAGSHDAARAQADDLAEGAVVEDAGQHDGHARPSGQVTADRLACMPSAQQTTTALARKSVRMRSASSTTVVGRVVMSMYGRCDRSVSRSRRPDVSTRSAAGPPTGNSSNKATWPGVGGTRVLLGADSLTSSLQTRRITTGRGSRLDSRSRSSTSEVSTIDSVFAAVRTT